MFFSRLWHIGAEIGNRDDTQWLVYALLIGSL